MTTAGARTSIRPGRGWLSAAAAVMLALTLLAAPARAAVRPLPHGAPPRGLSPAALRAWHHLGPPRRYATVPGRHPRRAARRAGIARAMIARPAPQPSWPAAGAAVVIVPGRTRPGDATSRADTSGRWAQAGGLPVSLAAAGSGRTRDSRGVSRVRVRVAGHAAALAAGVAGFLFTVSRADQGAAPGPVRVRAGYAGFASAYGGGFGSRLTLVAMPGCALTTPAVRACRQMRPVRTANDFTARSLTARVTAAAAGQPGSVLAVTSSAGGSTGDFKATSLTPSSTWQVGLQSGDFTWSYPLRVPPPIGGATPHLALAYDSGSIDGETAQSNSQPGQLGEGFSLAGGGFIERKYAACADHVSDPANTTDQKDKTGDLCWDGENAYLNLDGRTTQIIQDAATGVWRLASDDGSTIRELTGAANGAYQGQYWKLITADGTQYVFGMNQLPGWASGDQATNSAWTVPVVGLKTGDPCHASGYSSAACPNMAWRWNLDLVVDPNGNATQYYYNPETNYYSFNSYVNDAGTLVNGTKMSYTSGGTLAKIVYGSQAADVYAHQPFTVSFGYSDRCTLTTDPATTTASDISTCNANHNDTYWPDTPWDLSCTSASTCTGSGHEAPSFFSTQMLTSVTTKVDEGGSSPASVDTWLLAYSWLSSETSDLFLTSIRHTGDVGGSASLDKVTFAATPLINRVPDNTYPAMTRYRIGSITTETGARINVSYNNGDCGPTRPSPSSDTLPCFQQWWADGDIGGTMVSSWFYKYTVAEVDVSDTSTADEPMMPTRYIYNDGNPGGAAWRYDTDIDLVQAKYKSYSQWRGYQHVTVITGSKSDTQSQSDYTFMRGMDGNPVNNSGTWDTQSASVTDSRGQTFTDSDAANGSLLEKITRNGPGGAVVSDEITQPWLSAPTATSAAQPWGGRLTAVLTGTAQTDTYAPAVSGTRHTQVINTYDPATGLLTQTDDEGDVSVAAQELCTGYGYAQNTAQNVNMLDYPSEVKVTAGPCNASSPPLVSDTRYLYDGGAFGAAPTDGNVTETDAYSSGDPGVAGHWVKVSRKGYDSYGRITSTEDAGNNTTTTSYGSYYGTGLATTQAVATDPLGHVTTTDLRPEWGSVKDVFDAAGEETSYAYDPLGRVIGVWLPGQSQAASDPASYTYHYNVTSSTSTLPSVTVGRLINGSSGLYVTSYELLDSLLRPRQTQAPAEGIQGGAEVTDTFYDSRGNIVIQNGPYPISSAPSASVFTTTEPGVPNETASSYDGAGRLTEQDLDSYGALQWKTTYAYPGVDAVTVTPPAGGTAATTYTDARGHTTDIYQYHSSPPPTSPPAAGTGSVTGSAGWDHTGYAYTPAGQLAGITDPAGNAWSYGYDLLGRQITATTPDAGTTTSTYNDLNQLTAVTDARGKTLTYAYDADGRKTAEYDTTGGAAPGSGNQLAAWTYDTATLNDPALPAGSQAIGQLASATSYTGGTGGEAYAQTINSYDPAYHPTSTTYSIAATGPVGALAGKSYTLTAAYNTDGTIHSQGYPAAGGLQAETVTHNYNNLGDPYSAFSSVAGYGDYVEQSYYAPDSQPAEIDLGTSTSAQWSRILYSYDPVTARLTDTRVQEQAASWANATNTGYGYDNAGNVTKISEAVASDTQCLTYDYAQRLTAAWAQAPATCPASPPDPSGLGGPAPYLQQLTYDKGGAGNITKNELTTPGATASTTLSYPQPGQSQPHTPSTITATVGGTSTTSSPSYTPSGQLHTTGSGATAQTFSWNSAGHLASASDGSGDTTSYRYDAAGNLLLRTDNGTTTFYLPGEELTATATTITATRYYTHAGQIIAARTPSGLSWLIGDPHGTDTVAIDTTNPHPSSNLTQRHYTPFGAPRGAAPASWPGDHGFTGGTTDTATGLTNLGAREYNPAQATFLSPDPLLTPYTPQDLNPYAYATSNPATWSDPTGLIRVGPPGSGCTTGNQGSPQCRGSGGDGTGSSGGYSGGAGPAGPGGTSADTYPGQYAFPERDRAAYIEWAATWTSPIAVEFPPSLVELDSVNLFCQASAQDCPGNLASRSLLDWVTLAGITVGGGLGLASLGREGGIGPHADLATREQPVAQEELAQLICGGQSFTPGTKVLLASGVAVPIASLRPGEKVLATNTRTGRAQAESVTAVLVHHDTNRYDLTVKTAHGTAVIQTTSTHLFWDPVTRLWVKAVALGHDSHLLTPVGVRAMVAGGYAPRSRAGWMWDLTVTTNHDFYIQVATTAVLVHNCPSPGAASRLHLTLPGPYARAGIALENGDINNAFVRNFINWSGKEYGCASCGAQSPGTMSGNWIPDHQPPTALVSPGTPQTAWPQCLQCARLQGGTVSPIAQEYLDENG